MAYNNGVNPHTAADLLRQAMAHNSAKHENRDEMHDHIGSSSPTPSGVETPRPDLSDKRLPGISSYFGQVGNEISPSSLLRNAPVVKTPGLDSSVETFPVKHVRETSPSRRSSASSGSIVMVPRGQVHEATPPLQPGGSSQEPVQDAKSLESKLPPTPVSSASSFLQRETETAENGRALDENGISSVTQAIRNFVLPKSFSSVKARRHQSLPLSSVTRDSVPAAHLSNPTSSSHSPTQRSPNVSPHSSSKPKNSKSFKELSRLTSNATPGSRNKNTPPLTPRTMSHEGGHPKERSPLSSTSNNSTSNGASANSETEIHTSPRRAEGLPTHSPRGKVAIKIAEGRNLKPSYDPYVVCYFEGSSEFVSEGPKHDVMDIDETEKRRPVEMRRQDSDMGKPMAIPMRSRQASSTGHSDNDGRPLQKITDPQWDHSATFDVLGRQSEIDISVYERRASEDSFLGHVRLCLNLSEQNPTLEGFFSLESRGPEDEQVSGEIHIKMHFSKSEKRQYGPNDFEIMRLVGKGTFGQVYQVRKKDTRRIYAMKVLSKKVIIQKKEVAHTLGERNILVRTATTDSPFIVGLKFSFQTPSDLYLVTDFMSGGELFWHLQKEGRFKEDRAKFYIAELILALKHLHDHDIVYRDLKPENILLDANGHIALCDFGLSKANLSKNDVTNTFCGTTEYLAPEVLLDEAGYTKQVDWWSLGVLIFEMCCGWSPFYAEDTQQMYKNIAFGKVRFPRDALSTEGRNLVKGLLNRNPKHRLGATNDAQELIDHPFFNDVDWVALGQKNLVPPFKPKLTGIADTSNFDPEFTNALNTSSSLNARAVALTAANGVATSTPLSPTMQNAFRGFTFVDQSMLEEQYGASARDEGDGFGSGSLSRSQTREHRMSGVEKTGGPGTGTGRQETSGDGVFGEENWEM